MNAERRRKLAELLPEGVITIPSWLMKQGFSRVDIDNLVKSGVLTSLRHGVYVRGQFLAHWQAVVYALQAIMHEKPVVGGLTALEIQGFAHYLPLSEVKTVHLYSREKQPSWLNTVLPDVFVWHQDSALLGRNRGPYTANEKSLESFVTEKTWREDLAELVVSSPERALLEVLTEVPENISFEHADQLMQGMTSLSPKKLQKLLELSSNVKMKRVFFWLADRHNYAWLSQLNKSRIDFGKGNRMLVKGGKLDKRYLITVPELYE